MKPQIPFNFLTELTIKLYSQLKDKGLYYEKEESYEKQIYYLIRSIS